MRCYYTDLIALCVKSKHYLCLADDVLYVADNIWPRLNKQEKCNMIGNISIYVIFVALYFSHG